MGLSQDLELALRWMDDTDMDDTDRDTFREIFDGLHSSLPVAQETLMTRLLPVIDEDGEHHRKFQRVHARQAVAGEIVISKTADGEETINTAAADDMLVRNLTEAQELYLVGKTKFEKLYSVLESFDDEWTLYEPLGEVKAIDITRDVTTMLDVGEEFYIVASWGKEQLARLGDKLVAPLPDLDEIYRIARKEFNETYESVENR